MRKFENIKVGDTVVDVRRRMDGRIIYATRHPVTRVTKSQFIADDRRYLRTTGVEVREMTRAVGALWLLKRRR